MAATPSSVGRRPQVVRLALPPSFYFIMSFSLFSFCFILFFLEKKQKKRKNIKKIRKENEKSMKDGNALN